MSLLKANKLGDENMTFFFKVERLKFQLGHCTVVFSACEKSHSVVRPVVRDEWISFLGKKLLKLTCPMDKGPGKSSSMNKAMNMLEWSVLYF